MANQAREIYLREMYWLYSFPVGQKLSNLEGNYQSLVMVLHSLWILYCVCDEETESLNQDDIAIAVDFLGQKMKSKKHLQNRLQNKIDSSKTTNTLN